jgi:hypothetical protein
MGLGKLVMEGEKALRFSPKYPQMLPQRSTVDEILNNSQRFFYSLKLQAPYHPLDINENATLEKREVTEAGKDSPILFLASTYIPEEHRIREGAYRDGHTVLTFSQVLNHSLYPLAEILSEALAIGQEGMGCPVELEFSVNLSQTKASPPEFAFLQLRPMAARAELTEVIISDDEIHRAFCFSANALGNAVKKDMCDILYVNPDTFDPNHTRDIAREIGKLNTGLVKHGRPYLLIGPGRWGSADRWLGIPARWAEICGVGAIVETTSEKLKAEPSQGSHFFHNISALGISYVTIADGGSDFLDWNWLKSLPAIEQTKFVRHVKLAEPITLKVDGRKSSCVMLKE